MDGRWWAWLRDRPAKALACAALLVVAAWFTLLPADASVTSDDGAYGVQVISLQEEGTWSVPHAVADVDQDGDAYPFANSSVGPDGFFPGGRHALWVQALRPGYAFAGALGMRIVPAVGLAVAVAVASTLAAQVHGRTAAVVAGGLVLTSPLLFHSLQLWGHAFAAGGVAVAALAAVGACGGRAGLPLTLAGAVGAASSAAVRSDSFVFALAVAFVAALSGLRVRDPGRIVVGVVLGLSSVVGYVLAGTYAASIVGSVEAVGLGQGRGRADGLVSLIDERIGAALHTFVSVADGEALPTILTIVALGVVAAATLAIRRDDISEAISLVIAAVVLWLLRIVLYPDSMASGLLGAWPVVLLAGTRGWDRLADDEKRLVAMVGLGALGIAATQYPEGGGLNWGGRFLVSAVPLLAVVVSGALVALARHARGSRLVPAIVALVLVTSGASLTFDAVIRTRHAGYVDRAAELTSAPVVTGSPALPRLAWRLHPEVQWLLVPLDDDGAPQPERLIQMLRRSQIDRITLYAATAEEAQVLTGGEVRAAVGVDHVTVEVP